MDTAHELIYSLYFSVCIYRVFDCHVSTWGSRILQEVDTIVVVAILGAEEKIQLTSCFHAI